MDVFFFEKKGCSRCQGAVVLEGRGGKMKDDDDDDDGWRVVGDDEI